MQPGAGRIRDVRQGPDGAIYLVTDNPKPDPELERAARYVASAAQTFSSARVA